MHSTSWEPSAWESGAPVRGYVWPALEPRAAVLLTHGLGEYAGRYVEKYHRLIPALVGVGVGVWPEPLLALGAQVARALAHGGAR